LTKCQPNISDYQIKYKQNKAKEEHMTPDIRWIQRYKNFSKAYELLGEAVHRDNLSALEVEGMIQRFEYTFELAWKTLKDYLEERGFSELVGSQDTIRLAFANGIINQGEAWMEMLTDRNQTTHLYDEDTVNRIAQDIIAIYYPCFTELYTYLEARQTCQ
jgi:nucleotidyltransferase substrate binding protein (TIGR01987 family)